MFKSFSYVQTIFILKHLDVIKIQALDIKIYVSREPLTLTMSPCDVIVNREEIKYAGCLKVTRPLHITGFEIASLSVNKGYLIQSKHSLVRPFCNVAKCCHPT